MVDTQNKVLSALTKKLMSWYQYPSHSSISHTFALICNRKWLKKWSNEPPLHSITFYHANTSKRWSNVKGILCDTCCLSIISRISQFLQLREVLLSASNRCSSKVIACQETVGCDHYVSPVLEQKCLHQVSSHLGMTIVLMGLSMKILQALGSFTKQAMPRDLVHKFGVTLKAYYTNNIIISLKNLKIIAKWKD